MSSAGGQSISLNGKVALIAGGTRGAGRGIAVDEVARLVDRIRAEQGRLDILINDLWGGENLNTLPWRS
jgi:NAD(P)-dependent dehydrogenase (short-subunit alcohol dehydrogenase family)